MFEKRRVQEEEGGTSRESPGRRVQEGKGDNSKGKPGRGDQEGESRKERGDQEEMPIERPGIQCISKRLSPGACLRENALNYLTW